VYDQTLFIRKLTEFTGVLLTPYDVGNVLGELADNLTEVLGLMGSGISMLEGGRLIADTARGPAVAAVEGVQEREQTGPCVEAVRTGEPVAVSDVAEHADRWGTFAEVSAELGIAAVASIPMTVGEQTLGALDLYSTRPREWTELELAVATLMASLATAYLVNASHDSEQNELNQQLQEALESRVVIEQAKGMVAAGRGVPVEEAFTLLRGYARQRGLPLKGVSEAVVSLGLEI